MAAFEELVARYERVIYNAAYRMLGDREDAKDITQGVFLKAFENLGSFDQGGRFYSWIYRIAVNESLNLLGRRGRMEPLEAEQESESRGPEETLAGEELGRLVQEALMMLKPDYRAVVVLRHFAECSYEEIAGILQIPEKTVKSRLFSARQIMKGHLADKGIPG